MYSATRQFLRPVVTTAIRSTLPLSTSTRLSFARSFHSTLPKMTVHNIETASQFAEAIAANPVVVVDWFATWCGPCKMIAPQLAKWSNEMEDVYFVKVDIDAVPELAEQHQIKAMPTFFVFKDGKQVAAFTGAVPPKLLAMIQEHRATGEAEVKA